MIIINHMKLVQYYGPQLRYGRVFNSGIDEHIRLGAEKEVRSILVTSQARQANLFQGTYGNIKVLPRRSNLAASEEADNFYRIMIGTILPYAASVSLF